MFRKRDREAHMASPCRALDRRKTLVNVRYSELGQLETLVKHMLSELPAFQTFDTCLYWCLLLHAYIAIGAPWPRPKPRPQTGGDQSEDVAGFDHSRDEHTPARAWKGLI